MEIPSPNEIFELVKISPIINTCLTYWLRGELTWEQTLMLCVIKQNEETEIFRKQILSNLETSVYPNQFTKE